LATSAASLGQPPAGRLALAFAAEDDQRAERALLLNRLVDAGEVVVRGDAGRRTAVLAAGGYEVGKLK
jgi:hypothetical protein